MDVSSNVSRAFTDSRGHMQPWSTSRNAKLTDPRIAEIVPIGRIVEDPAISYTVDMTSTISQFTSTPTMVIASPPPSIPFHPPTTDSSIQPLVFNVVGIMIGFSAIVIGGLQLRKMYIARKIKAGDDGVNNQNRGNEEVRDMGERGEEIVVGFEMV